MSSCLQGQSVDNLCQMLPLCPTVPKGWPLWVLLRTKQKNTPCTQKVADQDLWWTKTSSRSPSQHLIAKVSAEIKAEQQAGFSIFHSVHLGGGCLLRSIMNHTEMQVK